MRKQDKVTFFTQIVTILKRAVEGLYPPCCPFCDNQLKAAEKASGVCRKCQRQLVYITDAHCCKCGKPLENERTEYCYDCSRRRHNYEQARALLSYQGVVRGALYRFKSSNRREYVTFFGNEICKILGFWIRNCQADYLIPIPLTKEKERMRGYNQAQILARVISLQTGIPCKENVLVKQTETQAQKGLDARQRQKNLEQAFGIKAQRERFQLTGKRIILVDDIYTTGATVDAAAAVLRQAGVLKIYVLTVAIGG